MVFQFCFATAATKNTSRYLLLPPLYHCFVFMVKLAYQVHYSFPFEFRAQLSINTMSYNHYASVENYSLPPPGSKSTAKIWAICDDVLDLQERGDEERGEEVREELCRFDQSNG
ncbi:hypothetical protein L195_g020060 [Trifolium pratense]|uniref:Uncharacterized protein n=1 Tax=Trifolium pratense TaxID=57577 RepID=A0A2K3N1B1_TRIPR|nr:hypothetical protein L195_g020060 [Trifolium pratense]